MTTSSCRSCAALVLGSRQPQCPRTCHHRAHHSLQPCHLSARAGATERSNREVRFLVKLSFRLQFRACVASWSESESVSVRATLHSADAPFLPPPCGMSPLSDARPSLTRRESRLFRSENSRERTNALKNAVNRDSNAFKNRVKNGTHYKGCHCKKSFCQKKYCECFAEGVKCGDLCRCLNCRNMPEGQPPREPEKPVAGTPMAVNPVRLALISSPTHQLFAAAPRAADSRVCC